MTDAIGRTEARTPISTESESWSAAAEDTATGSPEMVIAQIAVQLEEAGARSGDISRRSRREQRTTQRAALAEKRKAAKLRLAAGITQAAGQAVNGAVSISQSASNLHKAELTQQSQQAGRNHDALSEQHGASDPRALDAGDTASARELEAAQFEAQGARRGAYGQFAKAGTTAIASGLSYAAERRDIEADRLGQAAAEQSESADAADEARESAQRFADKAMQHMSEVEEAKHKAAMAALRG